MAQHRVESKPLSLRPRMHSASPLSLHLCCCLILISIPSSAATDYYNHVIFDNSITPDSYYYSSGRSVFPSTVELLSGALPVEKKNFFTPPNALRLQWHSEI